MYPSFSLALKWKHIPAIERIIDRNMSTSKIVILIYYIQLHTLKPALYVLSIGFPGQKWQFANLIYDIISALLSSWYTVGYSYVYLHPFILSQLNIAWQREKIDSMSHRFQLIRISHIIIIIYVSLIWQRSMIYSTFYIYVYQLLSV